MLAQAKAKLQAEIEGSKNNDFVDFIGQFLLSRLDSNPDDAEKILAAGKTVQSSISAMAAEAMKKQSYGRAMMNEREAFLIVLNHFGMVGVPADPRTVIAAEPFSTDIADYL